MRRLAFLILLLIAVVQPIAAWAHASLIRAEPADGTTVSEAPSALRLVFNEPVSPLLMRLIDPSGETTTPEAKAENSTITITPGALRQGTHVLSWRVVSADGHPMGGSVVFSVGAPSDISHSGKVETTATLQASIWVVRFILYLGLFIGVGGAVFTALVADSRPLSGRVETWLFGMMVLALVLCPISLGLQGIDALALPLGDLWRPQAWTIALSTSYAWTVLTAAIALVLGIITLRWTYGGTARTAASAAAIALALALAISGHASTADPRWLSRASVFLHVLCVAFWIGSLLPLLALLYGPREGERALEQFSRIIPAALVALAATGIFLIYVQFDRFDAFWTTNYGLVLSAKIAAVLLLLGLGAANRYVFVPRLQRNEKLAARPLAKSFGVELAIAVAILATVGLWRFTPPPRALAAVEPIPIHLHGPKAMAQVEIEPVRARGAQVLLQIANGEFEPLEAKEVALILSNPAAGIEPMRREAINEADVTWRIDDLRIPLAGRWRVRVEILVSDFEKVALEEDVELPRAP